MPLDFGRLCCLRPYVYHLTHRTNLDLIEQTGRLQCAKILLRDVHMGHLAGERRTKQYVVHTPNGSILIRDQRPLAAGAIQFESGWTIERFIKHVNNHVFFWPGTKSGPITAGKNHYARYSSESPVILRFAMEHLASSDRCSVATILVHHDAPAGSAVREVPIPTYRSQDSMAHQPRSLRLSSRECCLSQQT